MKKIKKEPILQNNKVPKPKSTADLEDITEILGVAEMITLQINQLGINMAERAEKLEIDIKRLEKEIYELKR
jgi:hypothetical protein